MAQIRNAAKALIIREGHLLAIRMRDAQGEFLILPGGGQEPGETLAKAVARETREEIGAEVVVRELRYVREYLREAPHRVEFIFACTLTPGATIGTGALPDAGQLGPAWVPLAELPARRFYPLGLRATLARHGEPDGPVYLGDLA